MFNIKVPQHVSEYDGKLERYRILTRVFGDIVRMLYFISKPFDTIFCLIIFKRVFPENFYLIAGLARTGSTLLQHHLNNPPYILNIGEVYNSGFFVKNLSSICLIRYIFWVILFPKMYLNFHFNKLNHGDQKILIGFKYLEEENKFFLKELLENNDVKKLVMWRENIVNRFFSSCLAYHGLQWAVNADDEVKVHEIEIDLDEMMADLTSTEKKINEILAREDRSLKISYEKLMTNKKETLLEICKYLNINPQHLQWEEKLKKINKRPYCESISNYTEVRNCLKKSKYEHLID